MQPRLFDDLTPAATAGPYREPAPFVRGSATSEAAAKSQTESKTARDRAAILAAIRAAGPDGLTDIEIGWRVNGSGGLNLTGDTIRPRRGELAADDLIRDSGKTRLTDRGRSAVVWVAREFYSVEEK